MKSFALLLILFAVNSMMSWAQSAPAAPGQPFVVEYYYKAKWGNADEFLRLFKKNHYPLLKKQLFPDQETYVREEQRRFAILDAHWDVPTKTVDLEGK